MDLEIIILCKVRQTENTYDIIYVCKLKKSDANKTIYKTETDSQT